MARRRLTVQRLPAAQALPAVSAEYPDAAPFVADDCRLLAGRQGLYVVTARETRLLQLQQTSGA